MRNFKYIKILVFLFFGIILSNFRILANIQADTTNIMNDTLQSPIHHFTPESASEYIKHLISLENLWRNTDDSLKFALSRLVGNYQIPYDSVRKQLLDFDFTTVNFDSMYIIINDTLPLYWLDKNLFFVDSVPLEQSPYVIHKTITYNTLVPDSATLHLMDSIPMMKEIMESLICPKDTVLSKVIDYAYLKSKGIQTYHIENQLIVPPIIQGRGLKTMRFISDSSQLLLTEHLPVLVAGKETPFFILPDSKLPDSLQRAVETLLSHTWERDSVQLILSGVNGITTPFWLSNRQSDLYRYWLKNSNSDSVTVWLGNPSKHQLSMWLEESVDVKRMSIFPADDIPFIKTRPLLTLELVNPLKEIPIFWDFGFKGSVSLNQNYITYWAQGGESSFAGLLDISGSANYSNKYKKSKWNSNARLRYGNIWTKDNGARVNTDIVEITSQYNKIIAGKFDFSSIFYFKTQLAKGYNYPNDSVAVSKFLNPGTFTIGVGTEYAPFKGTLINLAPLSYKSTFVTDTSNIDQTTFGVPNDTRSKQEIGGQLLITNNFIVLDDVRVANSLRLFSSYANNPQNIDVDWELSFEKRISWIFYIKLNIHLIYDDDVLFPVMTPEGNEYKAPRTQFNQFLGLSISLNL